jgi:hypothetical protein
VAPLAAICRNAAVAGRKRNMADTAIPAPSAAAAENGKGSSGGARRGSRSRGGRGRSGAPAGRTVTVVIPKASAGPR